MNPEKHNDIPMEHTLEHNDDKEWDTCCSHSSKEFIKYIVTVGISIIVLIFCLFMIASKPEEDNSIYFSLLSSIISLYVPSPTLTRIKKDD